MIKPDYRFSENSARKKIAEKLELSYDPNMQDWEIEIALPHLIEKYLEHYNLLVDEDEKFVLMQIIVQSINDQESIESIEIHWSRLKFLLVNEFILHEYTIYHWANFDSDNLGEDWIISPYLRSLYYGVSNK
jgi:hypothetical protein